MPLLDDLATATKSTWLYWFSLSYFLLVKDSYRTTSLFKDDVRAKVQVYSLALIFILWDKPHYRSGTFQGDMIKNLRNVAIPGTGIPLSLFCYTIVTALWFVYFVNPFLCFLGAINKARISNLDSFSDKFALVLREYVKSLLHPDDWFSYWRLNCRLASYHAYLTNSDGYRMENKWDFLVEGADQGVPVSPWLDTPAVVVKDKNEEGGMGIFFYRSASEGGDWIIQGLLDNDKFVTSLLPPRAPLSTFRVITSSAWSQTHIQTKGGGARSEPVYQTDGRASNYVKALSCVFRAGRTGASTDHSSFLFDIDVNTGTILRGITNSQWYRLGLYRGLCQTRWLPEPPTDAHPDRPGAVLTNRKIPRIAEMLKTCVEAHYRLMPDVPLVGWDVALTRPCTAASPSFSASSAAATPASDGDENGDKDRDSTPGSALAPADESNLYILEVNLSCNFFRGTFDEGAYFVFMDSYFKYLEGINTGGAKNGASNSKKAD